jgi:hypothetical protein
MNDAKVVRFSWHPASDSRPDRMFVKFLFPFSIMDGKMKLNLHCATIHTVADTIDERLACQFLLEKGLTPVSKFEYQGKLFVIVEK